MACRRRVGNEGAYPTEAGDDGGRIALVPEDPEGKANVAVLVTIEEVETMPPRSVFTLGIEKD